MHYFRAVSSMLTFTIQQFSVSRVGLLTDTDRWFESSATLWGQTFSHDMSSVFEQMGEHIWEIPKEKPIWTQKHSR